MKSILTAIILSVIFTCQANDVNYKEVLDLFDLETPELANVKKAYDAKEYLLAGDKLLEYYRSRPALKDFVDRSKKQEAYGKGISDIDRKWADDSLKNIFVGQKSYDSFFLGEDIDWHTNPVEDKEWIHQLHRMYWWESLGRAYWDSLDEKYAKAWIYQFSDWKKKNPKPMMPAWRGINMGIRVNTLAKVFEYFIDSPNITPEFLLSFFESCHQQITHLTNNLTAIGNHRLFEAKGILCGGVIFPEYKDAASWRECGITVFNDEIKKQVYDDGMHFELSPSYHSGVVFLFLDAVLLAKINGYENEFPPSYSQTIEKMIRANYIYSLPDFTVAQFGNAWKGGEDKLSNYFKKLIVHFPKDEFVYFASKGLKGSPPEQMSLALKDGGFYSLRNGWDKNSTAMILKCGPKAYFHCHPDNGSFELYALGRHFMPDSGSYIYNREDPWHQWFRRTASHQTMTVNYEDIEANPNLLIWKTSDDFDCLVIENAAYDNLKHRRAVFFNKEFFVLVDDAIGSKEGDLRIHFQLMPCETVFDRLAVRTDFEDGVNLLVQTMNQDGLTLEKEAGWVSYEYTKKEARPAFSYKVAKESSENVRYVTVLFPYAGRLPKVDIRAAQLEGLNQAEIEVDIDGKLYRYGYNLDNNAVSYDCRSLSSKAN